MEQAAVRPVPLHREKHPDLNVSGCFGCKAAGIRFQSMQLREMRKNNTSEEAFKQSIYSQARRTGKDIRRAGVTSPSSGGLI